ncbi:unnamed protein product [Symbiodinium pilosum]|uniref:Uncharacterized protein n=1 Tax=Symbiodinium pilosum TaxID=2952 RepID=A0A812MIY5_SYMPI|nr:unnamed protein product [Symbiodinium pilosum]
MVLFPASVKFKYTEQLPWVYALMTAWATFCFGNTLLFQGQGWVSGCFAGMSFLAQALNPMMAVSFTLGQSCSASRLKEGDIACLNIGRTSAQRTCWGPGKKICSLGVLVRAAPKFSVCLVGR